MKYFADILAKFTRGQRIFVLFLLLIFTSGTYLTAGYFKTDDCSSLRKEYMSLQADYITLGKIIDNEIRKETTNSPNKSVQDTVQLNKIESNNKTMLKKISLIIKKHSNMKND